MEQYVQWKIFYSFIFISILTLSGCVEPIEVGERVITPSHIDAPATSETVNVILINGQSNATRPGLANLIKQEVMAATGRQTTTIMCAVGHSVLISHMWGGLFYDDCAIKRQLLLSNSNYRMIGYILIAGETDLYTEPYQWSNQFKQYKDQIRADFVYDTLPIVYTQLPNTYYPDVEPDYVDLFKAGQLELSEEVYDDNVRMVVTEHLTLVDDVHFHVSELPELAELIADELFELLLLEESKGIVL